VVSMATGKEGGRMFRSLYDGQTWREPVTISGNTTRVAGDDWRFSAEFAPTARKMNRLFA